MPVDDAQIVVLREALGEAKRAEDTDRLDDLQEYGTMTRSALESIERTDMHAAVRKNIEETIRHAVNVQHASNTEGGHYDARRVQQLIEEIIAEPADQSRSPATEKSASKGQRDIPEEMIDQTLADSFPASDPPSWSMGRDSGGERDPSGKPGTTEHPVSRGEIKTQPCFSWPLGAPDLLIYFAAASSSLCALFLPLGFFSCHFASPCYALLSLDAF